MNDGVGALNIRPLTAGLLACLTYLVLRFLGASRKTTIGVILLVIATFLLYVFWQSAVI